MSENPKVTSKFDRMHGQPRSVHPVSTPGGMTTPEGSSPAPSRGTAEHGRQTHYHPTEHGRMDRGDHAVHPTHGGGEADLEDGE